MLNSFTKINDDEYFKLPKLNNSSLTVLLTKGIGYFEAYLKGNILQEDTNYFAFGKALHSYILEPSDFNRTYIISNGKKPVSSQMDKFCNYLANETDIITAYRNSYSSSTLSDEEVKRKAIEVQKSMCDYITTLKELQASGGNKKILDAQDYLKIKSMAENFEYYFPSDNSNIQSSNALNEHVLFFDYTIGSFKIPCKIKIDSLYFDNKNKTIVMYDLKTTENVGIESVYSSIDKYNYLRQAAFYYYGLMVSKFEPYPIEFNFIFLAKEFPNDVCKIVVSRDTLIKELKNLDKNMYTYRAELDYYYNHNNKINNKFKNIFTI